MGYFVIDWVLFLESMPSLIEGAAFSISIAACSALVGTFGGIVLALMEKSGYSVIQKVAKSYIQIIRGTPMLVQIMFLFYVCPQVGIWMSPIMAAITAMGLNSSAYLSQVIRVGVDSIDPVEWQATQGLGMNNWQTVRYLILPQTWRAILPALGNEATTLLKDSSLASVVGVMELTKAGALIRARTYDAFTSILAVAFVYFVLTLLLQQLFNLLEMRSKKPCSW